MNLYYLSSVVEWEKAINNNTMEAPIKYFVGFIILGLAIAGIISKIKK